MCRGHLAALFVINRGILTPVPSVNRMTFDLLLAAAGLSGIFDKERIFGLARIFVLVGILGLARLYGNGLARVFGLVALFQQGDVCLVAGLCWFNKNIRFCRNIWFSKDILPGLDSG